MPLYAYIKIPGISGSESQDADYGADWIPISRMEFSNRTSGEDTEFDDLLKKTKDLKKEDWEKWFNDMSSLNRKTLKHKEPLKPDPGLDVHPQVEKETGLARHESGGRLTISKSLDSTSPKLQLLCLQCVNYASNKYIDGKIELHICRHIPAGKAGNAGKEDRELYMAYILENCLIKSLRFDASDSSKINETITFTFEIIHSCVKSDDNSALEGKGWDFTKEAPPSSSSTPSRPPKK